MDVMAKVYHCLLSYDERCRSKLALGIRLQHCYRVACVALLAFVPSNELRAFEDDDRPGQDFRFSTTSFHRPTYMGAHVVLVSAAQWKDIHVSVVDVSRSIGKQYVRECFSSL